MFSCWRRRLHIRVKFLLIGYTVIRYGHDDCQVSLIKPDLSRTLNVALSYLQTPGFWQNQSPAKCGRSGAHMCRQLVQTDTDTLSLHSNYRMTTFTHIFKRRTSSSSGNRSHDYIPSDLALRTKHTKTRGQFLLGGSHMFLTCSDCTLMHRWWH